MVHRIDITGKIFGRLTAVKPIGKQGTNIVWLCECSCGNSTKVSTGQLRTGFTRSCGCYRQDRVVTHGASRIGKIHPLYKIWSNMISRCHNEKFTFYEYYGGRGIAVCEEWRESYEAFRDYMLALPNCPKNIQIPGIQAHREIDRIENNGNYEPGNVKWSTRKEQMNNRRSNRVIQVNGESMSFSSAVRRFGKAPYRTILSRLNQGWSTRKAFLTP